MVRLPIRTVAALGLGAALSGCSSDPVAFRPLSKAQADSLAASLAESGQPPADYVLRKLRENRVVFLGEMHRIRRDVLFVQELLPRLPEVGVRDLATEFYCPSDQEALDALVVAADYDESAARELLRHNTGGTWAYQEYLDLLHVAWEVNRERGSEEAPFRIVGLAPHIDWAAKHDGGPAEQAVQDAKLKGYDRIMAEALEREVLAHGRKALVYCGIHHAFTRFRQTRWEDDRPAGTRERCGNLVRHAHPDSVVTLYLHAPWFRWEGERLRFHLPCGGAFDQAHRRHRRPVGFDVVGTPFAALGDPGTDYARGQSAFTAGDFADGWILLGPAEEMDGVRVIPDWVESDAMFERLRRSVPNRNWGDRIQTVEDYLSGLRRDAEIQRIYAEPIQELRAHRP